MDFGPLVADMAFKKLCQLQKHNRAWFLGLIHSGFRDRTFWKPATMEEAKEMLSRLSGQWHSVFTGLSLVNATSKGYLNDFEESRVKFKNLDSSEIQNYIKTNEPMDKAGAYAIQGKGALFVEKIEGDYYNIVGLPLFKLNCMFTQFGFEIL